MRLPDTQWHLLAVSLINVITRVITRTGKSIFRAVSAFFRRRLPTFIDMSRSFKISFLQQHWKPGAERSALKGLY